MGGKWSKGKKWILFVAVVIGIISIGTTLFLRSGRKNYPVLGPKGNYSSSMDAVYLVDDGWLGRAKDTELSNHPEWVDAKQTGFIGTMDITDELPIQTGSIGGIPAITMRLIMIPNENGGHTVKLAGPWWVIVNVNVSEDESGLDPDRVRLGVDGSEFGDDDGEIDNGEFWENKYMVEYFSKGGEKYMSLNFVSPHPLSSSADINLCQLETYF